MVSRDPSFRPSTGTDAAAPADQVSEQLQEKAGQVVDQAQDKVGQVVDQAKQQTTSRLEMQKDQAAATLETVAQALRQTGQQLRDQDHAPIAGYADRAATQVERVSGYLHGRDVRQIVDETEEFARRQPVVFVGGALTLGLLAARFLKSSRRQQAMNATQDASTALVTSDTAALMTPPSPGPAPMRVTADEPVPPIISGSSLTGSGGDDLAAAPFADDTSYAPDVSDGAAGLPLPAGMDREPTAPTSRGPDRGPV